VLHAVKVRLRYDLATSDPGVIRPKLAGVSSVAEQTPAPKCTVPVPDTVGDERISPLASYC
jgi:hypothetical protein